MLLSYLHAVLVLSLVVLSYLSSSQAACYNDCSKNGVCSIASGRKTATDTECRCFPGFHGVDCSLRVCPAGRAWVDYPSANNVAHGDYVECSNMGKCNRGTGACECRVGFMGPACNQIRCPSGVAPVALQGFGGQIPCSGKGRCTTLRNAMLFSDMSRVDSDFFNSSYPNLLLPTNWPTTKASILASDSWEVDMIQGCICDPGWGGVDCSQRTCTRGDDPKTVGVSETQIIDCQCSGTAAACAAATLQINVRGQVTEKIQGTASDEVVRFRLNKLSTVEQVRVSIVQGDTLCSTGGSVTRVTFELPYGSYPKMIITTADGFAGTVAVKKGASALLGSVVGNANTRESIECSNHGTCNRNTGNCQCFLGYSSSNGFGMPGTRNDCGYYYGALTKYYSYSTTANLITTTTTTSCPVIGGNVCNNQGTCNEALASCTCSTGWQGPGCDQKACPKVTAWFTASPSSWYDMANNHNYKMVCSGVGDCDYKTGKCINCGGNWGMFEGDNCETLSCPSTGSGASEKDCGGNGACKSMSEMANYQYTKKGELAQYTYTTPWDSTMIKGCVCERAASVDNKYFRTYGNPATWTNSAGVLNTTNYDASKLYNEDLESLYVLRTKFYRGPYAEAATDYAGYNCAQMKCPAGDDPFTLARGNDIQQLTFSKTLGMFQLKFRENVTRPISCNDSLAMLHYRLEEVFTIRKVDVFRLTSTTVLGICQTAHPVYVEFLGNFGELPLLIPMTTRMGSAAEIIANNGVEPGYIVVRRYLQTNREDLECSAQGNCNEDTGVCACRDYFSSSSSRIENSAGERGDCSYFTRYAKPAGAS